MEIKTHQIKGINIAEVISEAIVIANIDEGTNPKRLIDCQKFDKLPLSKNALFSANMSKIIRLR